MYEVFAEKEFCLGLWNYDIQQILKIGIKTSQGEHNTQGLNCLQILFLLSCFLGEAKEKKPRAQKDKETPCDFFVITCYYIQCG